MTAATYRVLHQDEQVLVVSKAAGVLTVARPGSRERCLLDDLRADGLAVAPVHRLDKDTSGVLLLNLDRSVRSDLELLFRKRQVEKTYLALVRGKPQSRKAVIDVPILDQGRTARVDRSGKRAVTRYETLESWGAAASLLRVQMETGRHNQIRVHMAHLGHPLLGDDKFGRRERGSRRSDMPHARRAMLHAEKLAFVHPATNKRLEVSCQPPSDFAAVIEALRKT
ncbi:MAG: RluA family pseudouridine synthase [Planctomycetota bacterium]|nr:RluA family pseudouridine synthase [Planctomycetota bacterium]